MSVYGKESARWHTLQHYFLQKTTKNYEHAVYLNNLDDLDHCTIIGRAHSDQDSKLQHYIGLQKLLEYAKSGDYRGWLVLDCDCFPIHPAWESILAARNAGIIRTENLDTFVHPSAVYCVDGRLNFQISEQTNLLGEKFHELYACDTEFFPLLRSNRLNLHPLMAGVYFDLFYHHCAGSRSFFTRSCSYHKIPFLDLETPLFKSPDTFVAALTSKMHQFI